MEVENVGKTLKVNIVGSKMSRENVGENTFEIESVEVNALRRKTSG